MKATAFSKTNSKSMSSRRFPVRDCHPYIALINILGDYGIGGYTYELAEGLVANGARVDVFTNENGIIQTLKLPRHHRLYPVLGSSLLISGRDKLRGDSDNFVRSQENNVLPSSSSLLSRENHIKQLLRRAIHSSFRKLGLSIELALFLKSRGYSIVWTQWPRMEDYGLNFWAICKLAGLQMVHTVHNVLPHEETVDDEHACKLVYKHCDKLIVHSEYSFQELVNFYPGARSKTLVAPHGTYSMFRRMPDARVRVRRELGIAPYQPTWLFFGAVRPYKNIEVLLYALCELTTFDPVLVIAGVESKYEDIVPGEPLGRTARLAEQLGVANHVRLLPGHCDLIRTAELFEAADIVPLPYVKSYGSGVLLLAMTFGNYIVASPTGGMDEYLAHYPRHTFLEGITMPEIIHGMRVAMEFAVGTARPLTSPEEFSWTKITASILKGLEIDNV